MSQSSTRLLLHRGCSLMNAVRHPKALLGCSGGCPTKLQLLKPTCLTDHVPKCGYYKKGWYAIHVPDKPGPPERSMKEHVSTGFDIMRRGIPKWQEEWQERFAADFLPVGLHGDYEYFAIFNSPESMKGWVVSVDGDFSIGKSKAKFTPTESKTALFHGYLNTVPPKDGENRASGYCNVRCPRKLISFDRPTTYDWSKYTHIYLKVRGDGRNYMLNVQMMRDFDIHWHDLYQFPLYTRGGPYWQIVKIPFSKFYMTHSGRVQDYQEPINLDIIKYFSIGIMDNVMGRFQLEIDSIALVHDDSHENTFDYEMYDTTQI